MLTERVIHINRYSPVRQRNELNLVGHDQQLKNELEQNWKHHTRWMKPDAKDHMLRDSIYMKQNRQIHVWVVSLCDPMDCNPPGSSVHGILLTAILEWVAMPFCRGSSWHGDQTHVSWICRQIPYHWATRETWAQRMTKDRQHTSTTEHSGTDFLPLCGCL